MIFRSIPVLVFAALMALGNAASAASHITVTDVWSRPATGTGVVYATIHNSASKADALLSASSSAAKAVEVHETVPVPAGGMPSGSMSSSMGAASHPMMMRPVRQIAIPAGGSALLKPGGYHIMLIGLRHDLKAGDSVPVTLRFRNAGTVHVVSHVRSMMQ